MQLQTSLNVQVSQPSTGESAHVFRLDVVIEKASMFRISRKTMMTFLRFGPDIECCC